MTELTLSGCVPTPLAGYLKAVGILRLVSDPARCAAGAAADADARGYWRAGAFHLRTRLDREALTEFFLRDYRPTPIFAPWNGGSGFFAKDKKDGFKPLVDSPVAPRFRPLADALLAAADLLRRQGLDARPAEAEKVRLVSQLRRELPDDALHWLDAALVLSGAGLGFPPLLGTGGNDGRLDFTNNFLQRLVSRGQPAGLFDASTGEAHLRASDLLEGALFNHPVPGLETVVFGQYAPGSAGGPNLTTGPSYKRNSRVNAWDFVLTIEGAILFAASAIRRHPGSRRSEASFPFTFETVGAGSGVVASADEDRGKARAEFWAPIWTRPATLREVSSLAREGRAVVGGIAARNGLDVARAASSLGVDRGIDAFVRYALVKRHGDNHLAVPLETRRASDRPVAATGLIHDLDSWFTSVRRVMRGKGAPSSARGSMRRLDDALFALADASSSGRDLRPIAVQRALSAIGDLVSWIARARKWREKIPPPPRLPPEWVCEADDCTAEFRVAAALAGLGWRRARRDRGSTAKTPMSVSGHRGPGSRDDTGDGGDAPGGTVFGRLPLAAHMAPVVASSIFGRRRRWCESGTSTHVVWASGGLDVNLVAVLERRRLGLGAPESPGGEIFTSGCAASLRDILAFLESGFDARRCQRLLAGLVWTRPSAFLSARDREVRPSLPLLLAILKPLFISERQLRWLSAQRLVPPDCHLPAAPGLVARLRRGDLSGAEHLAVRRARASGLPTRFAASGRKIVASSPRPRLGTRLAAAMMIPVNDFALRSMLERAYPRTERDAHAA